MIVRELMIALGFDMSKLDGRKVEGLLEAIKSKAKQAVLALAGLGSVKVVSRELVQFAAEADKIAKTSSKLGVATNALQELRYAGELTGVAAATMDMAMQRFVRRTAQAAKGQGEAVKALHEMGVRLRDDRGKLRHYEALLGDVADAMAKVKNGGDRARLAMALFDTEGVGLVNTLKGGRSALEQMRAELRRVGGVIEQDTLVAAEAMNDEMLRLNTTLYGLKARVLAPLLPVVRGMSEMLRSAVVTLWSLRAPLAMATSATLAMAGAQALLGGAAAGAAAATWAALAPYLAMGAAFGLLVVALDEAWVSIRGGESLMNRFRGRWTEAATEMLSSIGDGNILLAGARLAGGLVMLFIGAIDTISSKLTDFAVFIWRIFTDFDGVMIDITHALMWAFGWIPKLADKYSGAISNAANRLNDWLYGVLQGFVDWVGSLVDTALESVTGLGDKFAGLAERVPGIGRFFEQRAQPSPAAVAQSSVSAPVTTEVHIDARGNPDAAAIGREARNGVEAGLSGFSPAALLAGT